MITNKSVSRMSTGLGFPDLRISEFLIPPLPEDVTRRFPSMGQWHEQLQEAHKEWRSNLQRALEQALQSIKSPK